LCLEKWFADDGIVNFPLAVVQAGEEFLKKLAPKQIYEVRRESTRACLQRAIPPD